jgi:lysophospholipase
VGKLAAGFPITVADVYGRALARHFVNGTTADDIASLSLTKTHGAGITWSGLASSVNSLVTHNQPFPIIISNIYSVNGNYSTAHGNYIPQTNPILEYNLYETGSWDPSLAAFAPTQYLGTTNSSKCVQNYDQASFVMGSSSFLFNEYDPSQDPDVSTIVAALEKLVPPGLLPNIELDGVAIPNPFKGIKPGTFIQSGDNYLTPVDGGEDGEVIPIQPLLVKARGVDVILAIDAVCRTG